MQLNKTFLNYNLLTTLKTTPHSIPTTIIKKTNTGTQRNNNKLLLNGGQRHKYIWLWFVSEWFKNINVIRLYYYLPRCRRLCGKDRWPFEFTTFFAGKKKNHNVVHVYTHVHYHHYVCYTHKHTHTYTKHIGTYYIPFRMANTVDGRPVTSHTLQLRVNGIIL